MMERSNEPVFWAPFGAGGMLAALVAPVLIFITGIAVPAGIILSADAMSYPRMLALAQDWFGKLCLFAVVSLFLWHAMHRVGISLHHLGVHVGPGVKIVIYGIALLGTVAAAYVLLAIGFGF